MPLAVGLTPLSLSTSHQRLLCRHRLPKPRSHVVKRSILTPSLCVGVVPTCDATNHIEPEVEADGLDLLEAA